MKFEIFGNIVFWKNYFCKKLFLKKLDAVTGHLYGMFSVAKRTGSACIIYKGTPFASLHWLQLQICVFLLCILIGEIDLQSNFENLVISKIAKISAHLRSHISRNCGLLAFSPEISISTKNQPKCWQHRPKLHIYAKFQGLKPPSLFNQFDQRNMRTHRHTDRQTDRRHAVAVKPPTPRAQGQNAPWGPLPTPI